MSRRVALITGASRGIGAATARALAKDDWDLVLAARSAQGLEEVAGPIRAQGREVLCAPTDLADRRQIDPLFARLEDHFHRLDALVNNAAATGSYDLLTMPRAAWDRMIEVNLNAPMFCAQHAARIMTPQQSGVIVNISSVVERQAIGNNAAYTAAKGGLQALTRALAVRLGRSGIRVVTVSPGHIETNSADGWTKDAGPWLDHFIDMTPLGRGGRPEEVADLVAFLCGDKAAFITGADVVIDGGRLAAIYPESLRRTLAAEQNDE